MPGFFHDWALWEKMSLVLVCAILITLSAGCAKLLYNRCTLQRYSAASQSTELTDFNTISIETPFRHDIEASRESRIPFGVRALESGVEIEGVWISPSSSPRSSRESSPTSWNKRAKFSSGVSQSSLLRHELSEDCVSATSRSSIRRDDSAFDLATGAERIPSTSSMLSSTSTQLPRPISVSGVPSTSTAQFRNLNRERHLRGRSLPRDLSFLDIDPFPSALTGHVHKKTPSNQNHSLELGQNRLLQYTDPVVVPLSRRNAVHYRSYIPNQSRSATHSTNSLPRRWSSTASLMEEKQQSWEKSTCSTKTTRKGPADQRPHDSILHVGNLREASFLHPRDVTSSANNQIRSTNLETAFSTLPIPFRRVEEAQYRTNAATPVERSSAEDFGNGQHQTQRLVSLRDETSPFLDTLHSFSVHTDPEFEVLRKVNTGFAILKPGTIKTVTPQVAEAMSVEDLDDYMSTNYLETSHKLRKKEREHGLRQKFKTLLTSNEEDKHNLKPVG